MDTRACPPERTIDTSIDADIDENTADTPTAAAVVEADPVRPAARTHGGGEGGLVTTSELARVIGKSDSQVRRLARQNVLPVARVENGVRLYDPVTVVEKLQVTRTTTRTIERADRRSASDAYDDQEIDAMARLADGEDVFDVARELRITPRRIEAIYASCRRLRAAQRDQEETERAIETRHRAAAAARAQAQREAAAERAADARRRPARPPATSMPKWGSPPPLRYGPVDPNMAKPPPLHFGPLPSSPHAATPPTSAAPATKQKPARTPGPDEWEFVTAGTDEWHRALQLYAKRCPSDVTAGVEELAEAKGIREEQARAEIAAWRAAHPLSVNPARSQ